VGLSIAEAVRQAAARLAASSDTARLDAELLMAHALGVTRSELLIRHLHAPEPAAFEAMIERRLQHEPVAYIIGEQEFHGRVFKVSPAVLIPRPDSETLVDAATAACPEAGRVLDCGTGSGALLLSVLAEMPNATGVGIDRSEAALAVACENAARLGLNARVAMQPADWNVAGWAKALAGPVDLVLANPPYVEDQAELPVSVVNFEPAGALFAGADGLDDYHALIPQLDDLLTHDGVALFEIGATQAEAVSAIAGAAGFAVTLHRDLAGRPRVVEMRRSA
jgi:release factor glutamine methyltransferase